MLDIDRFKRVNDTLGHGAGDRVLAEIAEEIALAIREHVRSEPDVPPITASIGVAPFGTGLWLSYETVLARADAAMYAAKEDGRDSVRTFGADEDAEAAGRGRPSRPKGLRWRAAGAGPACVRPSARILPCRDRRPVDER
jgi:GGDEF domain-containing protein